MDLSHPDAILKVRHSIKESQAPSVVMMGQDRPGQTLTMIGVEADGQPCYQVFFLVRRTAEPPPFQATPPHVVAAAHNGQSSLSGHRPDDAPVASRCPLSY